MNIYIENYSAFSTQEHLDKKSIADWKKEFVRPLETDFKVLIKDAGLRRMPLIMKKSLAAASTCLGNSIDIGGISLATGMGCTNETLSFHHSIENNMLKPAAFIQSTHTSISGKIAEYHQLHCSNITHVHADIAFENALIEAITQLHENIGDQLIGAFDEYNQEYETIKNTLSSESKLSEGVLFFLLSNKKKKAITKLTEIKINISESALKELITSNDQSFFLLSSDELAHQLNPQHHLTYTNYSGDYNTAPAFGFYMAVRMIEEKNVPSDSTATIEQIDKVVVINKSCHGYTYFVIERHV